MSLHPLFQASRSGYGLVGCNWGVHENNPFDIDFQLIWMTRSMIKTFPALRESLLSERIGILTSIHKTISFQNGHCELLVVVYWRFQIQVYLSFWTNLYTPYAAIAMTETATETSGFHMALSNTINAAIIANVPSFFVFIPFPFVLNQMLILPRRKSTTLIGDLPNRIAQEQ